ncbi:MAG: D-alanyl-D-alanine carboxypeptidase [Clostridia bacterium]|nr:D-alanyl-D-alanine carboxypeptidase [Clostridia bacterium]
MKRKVSFFYVFMFFLLSFSILLGTTRRTAFVSADSSHYGKSAILVESNSGEILYSRNETERFPIASMCKIMTLLLTFENIDCGELGFDEEIVVSDNAAGMGGSQVFLESGASYKTEELIKSIVVASANDSCVALAERICGSEDLFVNKMNEKADELGMDNTNFVNCTGLPKPGQFSCAKDVAVMFSELIKHEDYFRFSRIWMDEIEHPQGRKTEISNTNKLIRFYEGCDGGKTGYTSEAGHCLCATAKRNGLRLISVVISAPSSKERFKETSEMFNFGFGKYTLKAVVNDKDPLDFKVEIHGGKQNDISVIAERPSFVLSEKTVKVATETEFIADENLKAPINKGDRVGILRVFKDGELIDEINVLSLDKVDKKTYFDYIKDIDENWAVI